MAEILALLQWFVILFTGQRNEALWNFQRRTSATRPGQRLRRPDVRPVPAVRHRRRARRPRSLALRYEEPANRLTNGLRFIWTIPALFILDRPRHRLGVVVLFSWFAIVITGKHPRGMFDFSLRRAAVHPATSTPTGC